MASSFLPALPVIGIIGLIFAGIYYMKIIRMKVENELILKISGYVHDGAMAFLKREYTYLVIFLIVIFIVLLFIRDILTAVAFLLYRHESSYKGKRPNDMGGSQVGAVGGSSRSVQRWKCNGSFSGITGNSGTIHSVPGF